LPLTAGASAHVLLAFSDVDIANTKTANSKSASSKTAKAKSAKDFSAKELAVQQGGHYISLGERDPHVASVAVPVFDLAGQFRGALAVSGLLGRFQDKARQVALAELAESAHRLRSRLPGQ
jgi:DNA-binding IclR family transcriptional regulator